MRAITRVVGSSLVIGVVACSSGSPSTTSDVILPKAGVPAPVAPSTPAAVNGRALVYFDGAVDSARGVMNLVVRAPTGEIRSQATLPYGDNPGQVYMHTCAAGYNSGTHQLVGNVQAVNLMSGTVTGLDAVVDSISVTGVTLASGSGAGGSSGIIASYGSVAVNTADCTSTAPWAFQNLSGDPSFTFKGHADGTAAVQTFQFTDTSAIDLPEDALVTFFNGFTTSSSDFFFLHLNSTARNDAICLERADFYVSNYLALNATMGGQADSGSWNKYVSSNGGSTWSASDTSTYPTYYGDFGPGTAFIDWGVGFNLAVRQDTYIAVWPGHDGCGNGSGAEVYNGNVGCEIGSTFTLKVGASRASACGF